MGLERALTRYIDPRTRGVKWDGVTDDTAALLACFDYAATFGQLAPPVLIPPGKGLVSSTITVPIYCSAFGFGDQCIVVCKANVAAGFSVFKVVASGANSAIFRHFAIWGDGGNQTQTIHGLHFAVATTAGPYNVVEGMYIKEMRGNALRVDGSVNFENSRIVNCMFRDSHAPNVYMSRARDVDFVNCRIRSAKSGYNGVTVDSAACINITFNACRFDSNGAHGLEATQAERIFVEGCEFTGNTNHNVRFDRVSHGGIKGGFNDQAGNRGVSLETCTDVSVGGAHVRSSGHHGIVLATCDDCTVVGNHIYDGGTVTDVTYDGIIVDNNANGNNIQANTVRRGAGANRFRYGINVANADCDDNLVTNNDLLTAGVTGNFNNAGTGTITAAGNRV